MSYTKVRSAVTSAHAPIRLARCGHVKCRAKLTLIQVFITMMRGPSTAVKLSHERLEVSTGRHFYVGMAVACGGQLMLSKSDPLCSILRVHGDLDWQTGAQAIQNGTY